jgi:flagellar basal body L-ring protein FlgH
MSIKTLISIGTVAALAAAAGAQTLPHNFSLYTDKKAKRVEDVITVLIVENAKASNDAKTSTDKSQNATVDIKPFNVAWNGGTPTQYTPTAKGRLPAKVK